MIHVYQLTLWPWTCMECSPRALPCQCSLTRRVLFIHLGNSKDLLPCCLFVISCTVMILCLTAFLRCVFLVDLSADAILAHYFSK
jgi:hypothetical protein